MTLERILEYIKRTNPQMAEKKLLEELSKCQYSTVALIIACEVYL